MSNTLEIVQNFLMPLSSEPYFVKLYEQIEREVENNVQAEQQYDRLQKLTETITISEESLRLSKRVLNGQIIRKPIRINEGVSDELSILVSTIVLRGEKKLELNPEIINETSKNLDKVADNYELFIKKHPSFFDELLVETSVKYAKDTTFAQEIQKGVSTIKEVTPTLENLVNQLESFDNQLESFSEQTGRRRRGINCTINKTPAKGIICVLTAVAIVIVALVGATQKS